METLSKLPVWLRWLLVPIAASLSLILVGLIAGIFFWLQAKFLGLGEGAWLYLIQKSVLAGGIAGFSVIHFGVIVAPSGKKVTSLVLGALFVMMGGLSLLIALEKRDFWGAAEVVSVIVGIGIGVYTVFETEHKASIDKIDSV